MEGYTVPVAKRLLVEMPMIETETTYLERAMSSTLVLQGDNNYDYACCVLLDRPIFPAIDNAYTHICIKTVTASDTKTSDFTST